MVSLETFTLGIQSLFILHFQLLSFLWLFQAEFLSTFRENKWPRRVELSDGEYIMMHNVNVIVHFVPNNESGNWSGEDTLGRPKVVRRGVADIEDEIDDGRLFERLHILQKKNYVRVKLTAFQNCA